jgi:hypothetical protein
MTTTRGLLRRKWARETLLLLLFLVSTTGYIYKSCRYSEKTKGGGTRAASKGSERRRKIRLEIVYNEGKTSNNERAKSAKSIRRKKRTNEATSGRKRTKSRDAAIVGTGDP